MLEQEVHTQNLRHMNSTQKSAELSSSVDNSDCWQGYVILPEKWMYSKLPEYDPATAEKILRDYFLTQKYPDAKEKFTMVGDETGWEDWSWKIEYKFRRVLDWSDVCIFPTGHEMPSPGVWEGTELQKLHERYTPDKYKISQDGDKFKVEQLCPCGETECEQHIFPSKVLLQSSFQLAIHTIPRGKEKKNSTQLAPLFRKQHAMTFDEAQQFFNQFQLHWKVFITALKITFWMVCKCGEAFEDTPCAPCAKKTMGTCSLCGDERVKRMLKKQHPSKKSAELICSDCKYDEVFFCTFCKKKTQLYHDCVPLANQDTRYRVFNYKELIRSKGAKIGICPYCRETCSYNTFARHFQRQHNDLKPVGAFSHELDLYKCDYCDYENYDKTNVKEHSKIHRKLLMHPCKLGCGESFRHHTGEIQHRRKVHGIKFEPPRKRRRVGNKIELEPEELAALPEPAAKGLAL